MHAGNILYMLASQWETKVSPLMSSQSLGLDFFYVLMLSCITISDNVYNSSILHQLILS